MVDRETPKFKKGIQSHKKKLKKPGMPTDRAKTELST